MKKKIALIVDSDDWAFANIAKNIMKNVNKYEFEMIPSQYFNDNIIKVLIAVKDFDLLHFFWRGKLSSFKYDEMYLRNYLKYANISLEDFKRDFFDNKIITTAVYDHLFIDDLDLTNLITKTADNYYVCSNKLYDIYNGLDLARKPIMVITDGVNLSEFYPKNLERFNDIQNRSVVIGWVGNSAWEAGTEDFKGVNTILKPTIEKLIKKGYKITRYFADKTERMIPHDEMIDYYSKIDILICTSKIEGTPNPVLEAMACGVPVISTDVGIVSDAFGDLQKQYILAERSKQCLEKAIIDLINNPSKMKQLSSENICRIKNWNWPIICKKFQLFFDKTFEKYGSKEKLNEYDK